jgi:murein DD-endopeptidase MepM/ murein hydrolase activator NlpD
MSLLLTACLLVPPLPGPVIRQFAPVGRYGGHWGVDIAGSEFQGVKAPIDGVVGFAGTVAGMNTVTILGSDGLRVSLSYLALVLTRSGDTVTAGQVIGLAGAPHGRPGVHLSVRVGGMYRDPLPLLSCRSGMQGQLRLVQPVVRPS